MIERYRSGQGLPREHYIPIMRDVLEALIYLHKEKFCLHEDVKGTYLVVCLQRTSTFVRVHEDIEDADACVSP